MKRWREDLLDHLVWFILLHSENQLTVEEAVTKVKEELPCLTAASPTFEAPPPESR